ncbi:MAG: ABC transporter ATP-binding protein [Lachnospiraceae bacterium]|nr:ABC transporter ATP-binding protein [Lachnospiraceae bacterium]
MKKLFYAITCNEPKRLVKPILSNVLANLSNLLPFLCMAYIIRQIYDYFITGNLNDFYLWLSWGGMLICFVITYLLEDIACKITYRDGYMTSADGRVKLAEHIRELPLGVLMGKSSGEIGNTMMNDFSKTESAMTHILPQIVSGVIVAVAASAAMIIADWRMGTAMFLGFPVAVFIMLGMRNLERKLDTRLSAARVEQASKLQEYLYGMRIMKAYNIQGENFGKLKSACTDYRDACIRLEGRIAPLNLVSTAFLRLGLPLMTIAGVLLIGGGTLEIPEFAMFLLIGARVFDPLSVAIMNYAELIMCGMAGERISRLLEEPAMDGKKDAPNTHDIAFHHVTFGYGTKEVLHDITAAFKPDTMTALVGLSGSGKSTMLKLAARFYDPATGKVLFGGVDEKEIEPDKLMKRISMVFQDVYLFQDTVANNIRYGRDNATQEEIENAARLANCYDFIMRMPQGFHTMVGEGGSTLSGGEKQRISIARAVLKDAPVIFLDEATSSLDPENEAEIQQAISRLIKGRTVVVIAHKLKTIIFADNILVFDKGRIVEQGTHKELLSRNGLYAKLWNLQTSTEGWKIN